MVQGIFQRENAAVAPGNDAPKLGYAVLIGIGFDNILPTPQADHIDIIYGRVGLVSIHAINQDGFSLHIDKLAWQVLAVSA